MRTIVAALAMQVAVSSALYSQGVDQQRFEALRTAIGQGNVTVLRISLANDCAGKLEASKDPRKTVADRALLAREALTCARTATAALQFIAPPEKLLQVREVLATAVGEYVENDERAASESEFLGLKWGLGLGMSLGLASNVDDAEIVDGVVRVKSDLRNQPRALLEYHKFFWCNNRGTVGTRGCGPFIAAAATEKKVLSGVALGLMYGRKTALAEAEGFSLGIGLLLDASVRDLGAGFAADEAPPGNETIVRFAKRSRWATLLFVSRTF